MSIPLLSFRSLMVIFGLFFAIQRENIFPENDFAGVTTREKDLYSNPESAIIPETAVQDGELMQDFELESLGMESDHSQKVKAPPIPSDYGSKDCVNLPSLTADSWIIKDKYLSAQKDLLERNKLIKDLYTFNVLGEYFVGFPHVFSPKECCEDGFFVEQIPINQGDTVLEIGAGTVFFPVFAVLKGATKVIATDISQYAVDNIAENARLHRMESKIEAIQSDIFDALPNSLKFDLIYWNIPFTPTKESDLTLLDFIVFDPENKFLDRYLSEGGKFLKPSGRLFLAYSSTHGDVSKMKEIAEKYRWSVELLAQVGNEDTIILELYEFKK
jgi:SAM-dependent methyltransferase